MITLKVLYNIDPLLLIKSAAVCFSGSMLFRRDVKRQLGALTREAQIVRDRDRMTRINWFNPDQLETLLHL